MTLPHLPRNLARRSNGLRPRPAIVLAAGLVAASAASAAATAPPGQNAVTLYGGVRGGGDLIDQTSGETTVTLGSGPTASASFEWLLADGRQAEIFYSYQRSSLPASLVGGTSDVHLGVSYLHAGGRVFFDGGYATNGGYLVGGLGVTYFSPDLQGLSSEVRPSMNLGLGYQWMLSRQVAFRTEMRGYVTLVNSSGGFLCSGGCTFSIRGDALTQFEGMAGLSYGF
jgi:hypothetical protein